eukprot:jgi/Mesvir1/28049/Mv26197-RA.2
MTLPVSVPRPSWLDGLLTAKFFTPCELHPHAKKNERNIYCVDCAGEGICQHCLPHHHDHCLLQVRRYVYHDVVRLVDIQKLVESSGVQTYIINSARVVFLNQRPQHRPSKALSNACATCDRSLQDSYRYCSVACKVDAVLKRGADLASLINFHSTAKSTCAKVGAKREPIELIPLQPLKKPKLEIREVSPSATTASQSPVNSTSSDSCNPFKSSCGVPSRRKGIPQRSPVA